METTKNLFRLSFKTYLELVVNSANVLWGINTYRKSMGWTLMDDQADKSQV